MDYLNIEGLVVFAHHGVFPEGTSWASALKSAPA